MDGSSPPPSNGTLCGKTSPTGGAPGVGASDLRIKGTGRSLEDQAFVFPSHFLVAWKLRKPCHIKLFQVRYSPPKTPVCPHEGSEVISSFEGFFIFRAIRGS